MTFSTNATPKVSFSAPPPPNPSNYFLSQPHQPFFFFGVIWAIVSMVIFTLSHKGVLALSMAENIFHLYSLFFVVVIQFFHGFLFTTYPRFCMDDAITPQEYIPTVWVYQIFTALFFIGSVTSQWLAIIAMLGVFFAHSMAIITLFLVYRSGTSPLKSDPFWMLIAHVFGMVAHLLILVMIALEKLEINWDGLVLATPIGVNLFLVFLTFIAAQRMIPFFSHSMEVRAPYFVAIVFGLLVVKTMAAIVQIPFVEAGISIVLGGYLLREFLRYKLPLFHSSAILWILYLALFWLPIGLILGAVIQIIEFYTGVSWLFAGVHLLVLGFIITVLIGFGTRVTLGHSGQTPYADKLTVGLFWWTQVVVLSRLALSVNNGLGGMLHWLFDAATFVWIALFVVWTLRYGKTLVAGKRKV